MPRDRPVSDLTLAAAWRCRHRRRVLRAPLLVGEPAACRVPCGTGPGGICPVGSPLNSSVIEYDVGASLRATFPRSGYRAAARASTGCATPDHVGPFTAARTGAQHHSTGRQRCSAESASDGAGTTTAAMSQIAAAVVSPRAESLRTKINPEPRKPIPVTSCAATRDGSRTTRDGYRTSLNPYLLSSVNSAAPTPTRVASAARRPSGVSRAPAP